jgi:virginiamycin B lyase
MKPAIRVSVVLVSMMSLAAAAQALPEGGGKTLVETRCVGCHDHSYILRSAYTRTEWLDNVHKMRNVGAKVSDAEMETIVDYLARAFPEKPKPAAVIVPGDAKVTIREWFVPRPGARPHDPLLTADGMLWYTGQFANHLGRLDPKTGTFKEFPLKSPNSGPHGLVADRDGNIWYTGNMAAHVGKLDPRTGNVTEYKMPDPAAKDPHTPFFDAKGRLWFTVQGGNMVGRVDPATGDVKLVKSPTEKSRPYGLVMNSKGVLFFDEFGVNKIASIDPETMAIREWTLPAAEARPRRIAITPDDMVWYTDYSRGYLGRLDPVSGVVKEWPSPSGPKSQPYAMLADGDVIWYVESNTKPNALVRFDPKTEKFQSWTIPSGGGIVRHMMKGPDGRFALALSGVNGVAIVEKN